MVANHYVVLSLLKMMLTGKCPGNTGQRKKQFHPEAEYRVVNVRAFRFGPEPGGPDGNEYEKEGQRKNDQSPDGEQSCEEIFHAL
jgi:hypothetical protein